MAGDPIEGQIILITAAKASVPAARLPTLIDRTNAYLEAATPEYEKRYECVYEDRERQILLAEDGFWEGVCAAVGLGDRACRAVRRAHTEQLRRIGRRDDREDEFDAALEIREPVCLSRSDR